MAMTNTKSIPAGRPLQIWEGTLDLAAIPYGTAAMAEQDVTIAGIAATDMVVSFYATDAITFGIANARVKEANKVALMLCATDSDTEVNPANTINYRLITCPAI